jgi:hypothetical protein
MRNAKIITIVSRSVMRFFLSFAFWNKIRQPRENVFRTDQSFGFCFDVTPVLNREL